MLADFGFVAPMPSTIGSTTVVTAAGTSLLAWSRGYQAPELSDGKHGPPIDIYSYGVVGYYFHDCIIRAVVNIISRDNNSFNIHQTGRIGDFHRSCRLQR